MRRRRSVDGAMVCINEEALCVESLFVIFR